ETLQALIAQSRHYLLALFRLNQSRWLYENLGIKRLRL
ncbi:hypothetical protein, partial [Salmonella enterica]